MTDATRTTRFRFWLWLIALIGVIVPRRLRCDWRQEWEAELRYREEMLAGWDRLDWGHKLDLLRRSTSAFWDALWLQQLRWEDEMIQDVRFGVRMLTRDKGLTIVAVITLALGIGANTAIFSVVEAVLLRPLPYAHSERLVHVFRMQPPVERALVSRPAYLDFAAQQEVFDGLAAHYGETFNLTGFEEAERIIGRRVTADFFTLFGVEPLCGRLLQSADDRPDSPRVAVISYGLWQRRFGGAPEVIGRSLILNGESYAIIGVAPARFQFPRRTEIWTPALLSANQRRFFPGEDPVGKHLIVAGMDGPNEIIGLVGDARQWGISEPPSPEVYFSIRQRPYDSEVSLVTRTNSDPAKLGEGVRQAVHAANPDAPVFRIRTMNEVIAASLAQASFNMILMAVFASVALLLAAIGLYGVLAYSVAQRRHEIGIRMAVGAHAGDVLRLVIGEGMLLTLTGVVLGLAAAFGLTRVLKGLLFGVSATDPSTFAVITLLLAVVSLLACYLPARKATRVEPVIALRHE